MDSTSFSTVFEDRVQQLDTFRYRLEDLTSQLTGALGTLQNLKISPPEGSADQELPQAASALQSLPEPDDLPYPNPDPGLQNQSLHLLGNSASGVLAPLSEEAVVSRNIGDGQGDESDDDSDDSDLSSDGQRFGSLVTDSYGSQRSVYPHRC